jgi:hypothetical protein
VNVPAKELHVKKIDRKPRTSPSFKKAQLDTSRKRKSKALKKLRGEPRADHLILVVNTTDFQIRRARVNGGDWFATPAISRTCPYNDYDRCFNEGRYAPMLNAQCGQSIQITIGVVDASGKWYQTGWDPFTPDCNKKGSVIWFGQ